MLNVPVDPDAIARLLQVDGGRLAEVVEDGRTRLLAAREGRVKPGRDEKIRTVPVDALHPY